MKDAVSAGEVADEQQLTMVIGTVAVGGALFPALVLAGLAWAVWRGHDIARRLLFPAVAVMTVLCGILAVSAPEGQVQEPLQAEVDRLVAGLPPCTYCSPSGNGDRAAEFARICGSSAGAD
jgi:hypothetical protein